MPYFTVYGITVDLLFYPLLWIRCIIIAGQETALRLRQNNTFSLRGLSIETRILCHNIKLSEAAAS